MHQVGLTSYMSGQVFQEHYYVVIFQIKCSKVEGDQQDLYSC